MDEVFVECPEAKLIECINLDTLSYSQFAWKDNSVGAALVECGKIALDTCSTPSSVSGPGSVLGYADPTSEVKGGVTPQAASGI